MPGTEKQVKIHTAFSGPLATQLSQGAEWREADQRKAAPGNDRVWQGLATNLVSVFEDSVTENAPSEFPAVPVWLSKVS